MSEAVPEAGNGNRSVAAPVAAADNGRALDKALARLWIPHPSWRSGVRPQILPFPPREKLIRWGKRNTAKYLLERAKIMRAAEVDPLWHGWEPPLWTLNDCLLGMPWVEAKLAEEVRRNLGFAEAVMLLWLFGANRAAKSMYSARTMSRILWGRPDESKRVKKVVHVFGPTQQRCREMQMPKMWYYMPEPYRSLCKGGKAFKQDEGYIKYLGERGGFTDDIFSTPWGSYCAFKFYSQGDDIHEGGAQDAIWCTELVSAELVTKLQRGLADRNGFMIIDFTPIAGYSPAVRLAMNSAVPALESPAFLIPEDGGEPDVEAAMYVEDVIWRVREMGKKGF